VFGQARARAADEAADKLEVEGDEAGAEALRVKAGEIFAEAEAEVERVLERKGAGGTVPPLSCAALSLPLSLSLSLYFSPRRLFYVFPSLPPLPAYINRPLATSIKLLLGCCR
jgi:hypothetical protein